MSSFLKDETSRLFLIYYTVICIFCSFLAIEILLGREDHVLASFLVSMMIIIGIQGLIFFYYFRKEGLNFRRNSNRHRQRVCYACGCPLNFKEAITSAMNSFSWCPSSKKKFSELWENPVIEFLCCPCYHEEINIFKRFGILERMDDERKELDTIIDGIIEGETREQDEEK